VFASLQTDEGHVTWPLCIVQILKWHHNTGKGRLGLLEGKSITYRCNI